MIGFIKKLSRNDSADSDAHQSGLYVPKGLYSALPSELNVELTVEFPEAQGKLKWKGNWGKPERHLTSFPNAVRSQMHEDAYLALVGDPSSREYRGHVVQMGDVRYRQIGDLVDRRSSSNGSWFLFRNEDSIERLLAVDEMLDESSTRISDVVHEMMSQPDWRVDLRAEPNNRRRSRFVLGWEKKIQGDVYSLETLERLTWENLGHRAAARLNRNSVSPEAAYAVFEAAYYGSETVVLQGDEAYLLTWNPGKYPWEDRLGLVAAVQAGERVVHRWSTGNRTNLPAGSRVFLLIQGEWDVA